MRRNRLILIGLAVSAMAAPLGAQVVNGGFETGAFAPWVLSGNCGDAGIDQLVPHSGSFGMYAGPIGSTCDLTQTVATTIGQQYTFSFFLMNEQVGDNFFRAMFGAQTLETLTNAAPFAYLQFSYSVTAVTASTEIAFRFRNDPSFWDLDDVSLTAVGTAPPTTVPEPSTVAMFGAGLLGMAVFRMRRRA